MIASCTSCPFEEVAAFEVHYQPFPAAGSAELLVDGKVVRTVDLRGPGDAPAGAALGRVRVEVAPGRHVLAIRPVGDGELRVLGVDLEASRPGVTWEGAGLSGAFASTPLGWELPLFHEQLAEARPTLLALAYGSNEALETGFDPDAYRETFRRLVQRARAAAREASCLVIGPPDVEAEGHAPSPHLTWIVGVQREVAAREGCAFWDARAAMGGEGAMARWRAAKLGHADGVHFSPAGYRRLGDLLFEDLVAAYRERSDAQARQEPGQRPGSEPPR